MYNEEWMKINLVIFLVLASMDFITLVYRVRFCYRDGELIEVKNIILKRKVFEVK